MFIADRIASIAAASKDYQRTNTHAIVHRTEGMAMAMCGL